MTSKCPQMNLINLFLKKVKTKSNLGGGNLNDDNSIRGKGFIEHTFSSE